MAENEVRQFKLASGEEIVCEVVQWHNEEELELVVRKAMKLVMGEMSSGVKYYSFRPWMVYQENPEDFIVLNGNHVIGIGYPTDMLIKQYNEAVDDMYKQHIEREKEFASERGDEYADVDTINKMTKALVKEAEKIEEYLEDLSGDSASNVLKFDPSKRTLH